jgi:hypothetical protein
VTAASPEAEALVERRGRAGVVVLNRPKALNALTLIMVRAIAAALDEWERDGDVDRVVFLGAGEKAFCAGGDIRRLYDLGRAGDHDAQRTFWREEYQLDRRIKNYPKPIVALVDGIVMGGGVGLAINATHRVAGERFAFAMPELLPRRRRGVVSAPAPPSHGRLFRADRPARRRGRRIGVRSRPDLRAKRGDSRAGAGAGKR